MRRFPRVYLAPPNDSPYAAPAPQPPSPPPSDPGPGRPVAPPQTPQADAPPATPPVDPTAGFQQALERALGPIHNELASLREENAALRAQREAPPVPQGDDDFTQSFLNDPQGTIDSRTEASVKRVIGTMVPLFNELSGTAQDAIVEGHRNAIDTEFGNGAFQEEFMPVLSKRFEAARAQNPALLASREWIASEINGIKGMKMSKLIEMRSKADEARTEAQRAETQRILSEFNATNLTGGVRGPKERPREPTEAEQAYIDSCAKSGYQPQLETLRKSVDSGNTLGQMQDAFRKEGE